MAQLSKWAKAQERGRELSPEELQLWINDCRPPRTGHKRTEELVLLLMALVVREEKKRTEAVESKKEAATAAIKELASIIGKTSSSCYHIATFTKLLPELRKRLDTRGPTGLDTTTGRDLAKFPLDRQMAIYEEAQARYVIGKGVARKLYVDAMVDQLQGKRVDIPPMREPRRKPVFSFDTPPLEKKPVAEKEEKKVFWGTYTPPQEDVAKNESGYPSRAYKARWNRGAY